MTRDVPEFDEDNQIPRTNSDTLPKDWIPTTTFKSVDDLPSYDQADGPLNRALALAEEKSETFSLLQPEEAEEYGYTGILIGSVVSVITLALVSVLGFFLWRRRRDTMDVVSMHKLREEGTAAESFLGEETTAVIDIVRLSGQPALHSPDF